MIDLAAFYAAVANEGARPQPHGIDSIEQNGQHHLPISERRRCRGSAPPTARRFYQLKTMLQGVVARGTARAHRRRCRPMSPARPAPPRTPSTAGSSASPTTSPSRSGSATTMATASAARSAPARPARGWRCRSSSRSSRRSGPSTSRPRRRSAARRPRRKRQLVDIPIDYMTRQPLGGGKPSSRCRASAFGRTATAASPKPRLHRAFPARRRRPGRRHAISAGLARGRLCIASQPQQSNDDRTKLFLGRRTEAMAANGSDGPIIPIRAGSRRRRNRRHRRSRVACSACSSLGTQQRSATRSDQDYFWGGRVN